MDKTLWLTFLGHPVYYGPHNISAFVLFRNDETERLTYFPHTVTVSL